MKIKNFCSLFVLFTLLFSAAPFARLDAQPVSGMDNVSLSLKWLAQSQFAGYYAALEKGFYREEGINLEIKPGAPDINPQSLVSAGVSDFGIQWIADLFAERDRGVPVISIAQIYQSSGLMLVSRSDSGINTPYDFKGKKIGIWFFGNETQFYSLLRKLGINQEEVNVYPLKASIRPFLDKSYDVINVMSYNEYLRILDAGYRKEDINIIDFSDYGLEFPGDALFTTDETAYGKPGLCERMVRASIKGWKWALENKEEAADIVLRHDKSQTLKKTQQVKQLEEISRLIDQENIPLGFHRPETTEKVYNILLENRIISGRAGVSSMYTNSIWERAVSGIR